MARDLDPQQQADLTGFVNALAEIAGYTTTAEWARESGYPASNLSNLRNARGGVDGYNLLRLIRAAAARAEAPPEHLSASLARALGTAGADDSVADRLDELAGLVTEALELLRDSQTAAQQRTPGARRSRKAGGA
jgi:hypothetical protein